MACRMHGDSSIISPLLVTIVIINNCQCAGAAVRARRLGRGAGVRSSESHAAAVMWRPSRALRASLCLCLCLCVALSRCAHVAAGEGPAQCPRGTAAGVPRLRDADTEAPRLLSLSLPPSAPRRAEAGGGDLRTEVQTLLSASRTQGGSPHFLLRNVYVGTRPVFQYFDVAAETQTADSSTVFDVRASMSAEEFFEGADHPYRYYSGALEASPWQESGVGRLLARAAHVQEWRAWMRDALPTLDRTTSSETGAEQTLLWMGTKGVHTNLHYDNVHNVYVQLYGHKRFVLVSPADVVSACLHSRTSRHKRQSRIPRFLEDTTRSPTVCGCAPFAMDIVLQPGDVLYIPPFWLHQATALDTSISVSLWADTNHSDAVDALMRAPVPMEPHWSADKSTKVMLRYLDRFIRALEGHRVDPRSVILDLWGRLREPVSWSTTRLPPPAQCDQLLLLDRNTSFSSSAANARIDAEAEIAMESAQSPPPQDPAPSSFSSQPLKRVPGGADLDTLNARKLEAHIESLAQGAVKILADTLSRSSKLPPSRDAVGIVQLLAANYVEDVLDFLQESIVLADGRNERHVQNQTPQERDAGIEALFLRLVELNCA